MSGFRFPVYKGLVPLPTSVTLLELKRVSPDRLSAVLELDQLCFGGLWTLEGYQRELDSPNSELLGLFVPVGPHFLVGIGCLWAILDEAHITILAVHPQYQRQGLGQALLYSLLTLATDCGLERATLEVRASNHAALSLYQKHGFKTAGRRRCYYKDTGEFAQTLANWERLLRGRLHVAGWELQIMTLSSLPEDSLTME